MVEPYSSQCGYNLTSSSTVDVLYFKFALATVFTYLFLMIGSGGDFHNIIPRNRQHRSFPATGTIGADSNCFSVWYGETKSSGATCTARRSPVVMDTSRLKEWWSLCKLEMNAFQLWQVITRAPTLTGDANRANPTFTRTRDIFSATRTLDEQPGPQVCRW
jgi:hypothetical protein